MRLANNLLPSDLSEARSDVLNAFADLEYAVAEALKFLAITVGYENAPIGQKFEALANLKASSKISKATTKLLYDAALNGQLLCEIRNDLVHSRMQFVAGHPNIGIYLNVRAINQPYPKARVLSVSQHIRLASEARTIANCINNWRLTDKKTAEPRQSP